MTSILHILTKPGDVFAAELVATQTALPDCKITLADLTKPDPNYTELLEQIFAADSVAVW